MDFKDKWNSLTREQKALVVLGVVILGFGILRIPSNCGIADDEQHNSSSTGNATHYRDNRTFHTIWI